MFAARIVVLATLLAAAAAQNRGDEWVHIALDGGGVSGGAPDCARILSNGVFASFPMSKSSESRSAAQSFVQTAMCSAKTQVADLGTSRGGVRNYGVFVGDTAFTLAKSQDEAQKRLLFYRSNLCGSDAPASQQVLNTFTAWIDPNQVAAYGQCLAMWDAGLSLEDIWSRTGDSLTITMGYTKLDKGSVTFHRVSIDGPATCRFLTPAVEMFRPGAKLTATSGKHAVQCTRNSDAKAASQPVSVMIATSAGTRTFDFPAAVSLSAEAELKSRMAALEERVADATGVLQAGVASLRSSVASLTKEVSIVKASAGAAAGAGSSKPPKQAQRPKQQNKVSAGRRLQLLQ